MQNQNSPWINLKKLRGAKGWTQEEAADQLGFSRCYITSVENGNRGISKNMINRIIKVFEVQYDDFYICKADDV